MGSLGSEFEPACPPRRLRTGERVPTRGRDGGSTSWLLLRGGVRLDLPGVDGGPAMTQLALPGDLIGLDALCGHADDTPLAARALMPCSVQRVAVDRGDAGGRRLLDLALHQHWRRTTEIEALRTGSAAGRVRRLLATLAAAGAADPAPCHAPAARDIAELVDAPLLAVTRALIALKQPALAALEQPALAGPAGRRHADAGRASTSSSGAARAFNGHRADNPPLGPLAARHR